MPPDWKPSPPPKHGTKAWKRDRAVEWAIDHDLLHSNKVESLHRCPVFEGIDLGFLAVVQRSGGVDYIHAETIEPPP